MSVEYIRINAQNAQKPFRGILGTRTKKKWSWPEAWEDTVFAAYFSFEHQIWSALLIQTDGSRSGTSIAPRGITERQTDGQKDKQTDRKTDRQTDRQTDGSDGQVSIQTDRKKERWYPNRQTDRQATDGQKDKQTDRKTDRKTEIQTDRQLDRRTEGTDRLTYIQTERWKAKWYTDRQTDTFILFSHVCCPVRLS